MGVDGVGFHLRNIKEQIWLISGKGKNVGSCRRFVDGFEQDGVPWTRNKVMTRDARELLKPYSFTCCFNGLAPPAWHS